MNLEARQEPRVVAIAAADSFVAPVLQLSNTPESVVAAEDALVMERKQRVLRRILPVGHHAFVEGLSDAETTIVFEAALKHFDEATAEHQRRKALEANVVHLRSYVAGASSESYERSSGLVLSPGRRGRYTFFQLMHDTIASPTSSKLTSRVAPKPATGEAIQQDEPIGGDLDQDGWEVQAACQSTDPELFFPKKGGSSRAAKAVCAKCVVTTECLQEALEGNLRHGIWGGLTERERSRLKPSRP